MLYFSLLLPIILHSIVRDIDAYSIGDVDPRALRGIWRLTSLDDEGLPFERNKKYGRGGGVFSSQSTSSDPRAIWQLRGFLPMKEFTTYPKMKHNELENNDNNISKNLVPPKKQTEIFIKLKDDHTFEQCKSLRFSDGTDEESSLEEELELELSKRERESFALKGTWDFVDGNLILAADRPEKKPFSICDDDTTRDGSTEADTILVGKVSVQSEASLTENPALEKRQQLSDQADPPKSSSSQPKKGTIDIHLSVPKGKIKTGRFMYPKTHPVSDFGYLMYNVNDNILIHPIKHRNSQSYQTMPLVIFRAAHR